MKRLTLLAAAVLALTLLPTGPGAAAAPADEPRGTALKTGKYYGMSRDFGDPMYGLVITKTTSGLRFRAESADLAGMVFHSVSGRLKYRNGKVTLILRDGTTTPGVFVARVTFRGVPSSMIRIPRCSLLVRNDFGGVQGCEFYRPLR